MTANSLPIFPTTRVNVPFSPSHCSRLTNGSEIQLAHSPPCKLEENFPIQNSMMEQTPSRTSGSKRAAEASPMQSPDLLSPAIANVPVDMDTEMTGLRPARLIDKFGTNSKKRHTREEVMDWQDPTIFADSIREPNPPTSSGWMPYDFDKNMNIHSRQSEF
jgi:hypothetical protein